jgi:hypothetical protein
MMHSSEILKASVDAKSAKVLEERLPPTSEKFDP